LYAPFLAAIIWQVDVVCTSLNATSTPAYHLSPWHVQAFIGKIINAVHKLGTSGSAWASQLTEDVLRICQRCDVPAVKAACCTVLAEVGASDERCHQDFLKQLHHCVSDSRAAVREAAVSALGRLEVCILIFRQLILCIRPDCAVLRHERLSLALFGPCTKAHARMSPVSATAIPHYVSDSVPK
jgi:hypothetical protein